MSNLINDWLEAQRINGGPHGFECIGIARMQQVWDAAQEDLIKQVATRKAARKMIGFKCECGAAIDCTYPKCKEGVETNGKDITERLEDYARDYTTTTYHDDLIREAVTKITELRQQLALWKEAAAEKDLVIERLKVRADEADCVRNRTVNAGKGAAMLEKYLIQFMYQQTGLSVTPLLDAGLVYAEGPNNTWALTERGVEMLNRVGVNPAEDMVNHPAHYTKGGIECIDAIRSALTPEEFRGYCKGNAIKYSWRERHKGGNEDLKKASWYLTKISKE